MALIIDTETNGLPDTAGLRWGEYPVYNDLPKYKTARIVQFTFMLCGSQFEEKELHDYIVKRQDFTIDNQQFHGITNEISDQDGKPFTEVADIFAKYLSRVSHIVAHNIAFDINVIKAELYRHNLHHIIEELDKKSLLCTMKHTKPILKIINQYGNFKNPSLAELYQHNFHNPIENAHNSKYDVINLHKIVKHMHDNKTLNYKRKLTYTEHVC
jgi:DNA polymerase III epsilon subunit-like protein